MSRFTGSPEDRWPLREMLDELRDAARRAARPGWIWIAGLLYPSIRLLPVGLGTWLGSDIGQEFLHRPKVRLGEDLQSGISLVIAIAIVGLLVAMFCAPLARLIGGLSRLAPQPTWQRTAADRGRPGLRDGWRAGRGLTGSVLGLLISIGVLRYTVVIMMLLPAVFAWNTFESPAVHGPVALILALIALPTLAVLLIYNLALSLLQLLALQSLAHNRRGVASALQHSWSILRADPWAGSRALAGELLVVGLSLIVEGVVLAMFVSPFPFSGLLGAPVHFAISIAMLCFAGILGVTRACYWASAYRALGGLSPDDGVPGLSESGASLHDA